MNLYIVLSGAASKHYVGMLLRKNPLTNTMTACNDMFIFAHVRHMYMVMAGTWWKHDSWGKFMETNCFIDDHGVKRL